MEKLLAIVVKKLMQKQVYLGKYYIYYIKESESSVLMC